MYYTVPSKSPSTVIRGITIQIITLVNLSPYHTSQGWFYMYSFCPSNEIKKFTDKEKDLIYLSFIS